MRGTSRIGAALGLAFVAVLLMTPQAARAWDSQPTGQSWDMADVAVTDNVSYVLPSGGLALLVQELGGDWHTQPSDLLADTVDLSAPDAADAGRLVRTR